MKRFFLSIIIISLTFNCFSQLPYWTWAKKANAFGCWGGACLDEAYDIVTDSIGNSFITGYFSNEFITFENDTLTNSSPNNNDLFVAKYDSSGNVIWAVQAGGSGHERGYAIDLDQNGNVYVTGYTASPVISFGSITLNRTGIQDIFVVKYDNNGNLIWAKLFGGSSTAMGVDINIDKLNNVLITGFFTGSSVSFGSLSVINSTPAFRDIFIAKLNSNGNAIWAKQAGGNDDDYTTAITTDEIGNIYITGTFRSPSILFDTTTLSNQGGKDFFIAKLNSSGNYIWTKSSGGSSTEQGSGIAVDYLGNCYASGYFASSTVSFDTIILTNSSVDYDIFLTKYDSIGNVIWARKANGTGFDLSLNLRSDSFGNTFMSGYFTSPTLTFGSFILSRFGSKDFFIVKFDNSGNVIWAISGGGTGTEESRGVGLDFNDNIYVTGTFNSSSIGFGGTTLSSTNFYNVFVSKLSNSSTVSLPTHERKEISISPNPFNSSTLISFGEEPQSATIKIINLLGEEVRIIPVYGKDFLLEKKELNEGIYMLQVIFDNQTVGTKKMIIR